MNQATVRAVSDGENVSTLIARIACALVDNPDLVAVELAEGEDCTILRLRVDPTEVGKVIGKQGRTARSLRTILCAAGMKLKHRFSLDIVEETRGISNDNAARDGGNGRHTRGSTAYRQK